MGKATGFLEYERLDNSELSVAERTQNFEEFHIPLDDKSRTLQAARCMNCGVPFCQSGMKLSGMFSGCPLHNLIPEWNDEIWQNHYEHGFDRLRKTNNFPEFTGRVCPALCEKACICGQDSKAISIKDNELYLIEWAFRSRYLKPRLAKIRSGKKVAVIGSGPAGLAVADELNHRGHNVDVFEREDQIGGLLMYGIPNMKLDKRIILRRQKLMEDEGVVFHTGVNIKTKQKAEEILREYDAVVLCCGAKEPRSLAAVTPETVEGVYYAVDFLKSTSKSLLKHNNYSAKELLKNNDFISAQDKDVIIVGGGDTGNDCIGTVIRHACKSVTTLEVMGEPPLTRMITNPWPEWPKIKNIDYGHQEAINIWGKDPRVYNTTIKEVIKDKQGKINKVITVKVSFNNGKLEFLSGTEKILNCDLLLIAAGFCGCQKYTAEAFGAELTERGCIKTSPGHYKTNLSKVFTAGDMHRGQSLVVWAIAEGRQCAREVDEYLMGYTL